MINTSAASYDAVATCAQSETEERILWLQPRRMLQSHSSKNASASQLFLRLSASLSLGAVLTFGSVSTAIAPAAARTSEPMNAASRGESLIQITLPQETSPLDVSALVGSASKIVTDQPPETAPPNLQVFASLHRDIEPVIVAPIAVVGLKAGGEATESTGSPTIGSTSDNYLNEIVVDQRPPPDLNELLTFDGQRVPRWIVETILQAADVTGVDSAYLMALADKESSFIPSSKASTSSAEGLFQFVSNTWLEVVRSFGPKYGLAEEAAAIQSINGQLTITDNALREHVLGLRRDSYLAALMAAEMMKRDRARVERRIGRTISRSEFYLAHFFGADSASRFMSLLDEKPKQSAPRVFPAAARANRALFFAKQGRKMRHLTVAEVYDKIDTMIDQRLDRYEDVKVIASAEVTL
jgi:Transglycosylase SLT domain